MKDEFVVLEVHFNGQEERLEAQFEGVMHSAHHHEDPFEVQLSRLSTDSTVLRAEELFLGIPFRQIGLVEERTAAVIEASLGCSVFRQANQGRGLVGRVAIHRGWQLDANNYNRAPAN